MHRKKLLKKTGEKRMKTLGGVLIQTLEITAVATLGIIPGRSSREVTRGSLEGIATSRGIHRETPTEIPQQNLRSIMEES